MVGSQEFSGTYWPVVSEGVLLQKWWRHFQNIMIVIARHRNRACSRVEDGRLMSVAAVTLPSSVRYQHDRSYFPLI